MPAKSSNALTTFPKKFTRLFSFAIKSTLRHVQLQLVPQLTKWKSDSEEAKVAIYRSYSIAFLHAVPHLIPLLAIVVLIVLNTNGYFIGDISISAASAFQFAAKLLELMIQASLATILLSIVRRHVLGAGLPLGALFAPSRTTDVSYLWSLEFWGSVTAKRRFGWRMVMLLILIPLFVVLAAVVGPSTAVLIVPRSIDFPTHQYLVLLDSNSDLFPDTVNSFNASALQQTMPQLVQFPALFGYYAVSDNVAIRQLYTRPTVNETSLDQEFTSISTLPGRQTIFGVSLPTSVYASNFDPLPWSLIETKTLQPLVRASCRVVIAPYEDYNSTAHISFSQDTPELNHLVTVADVFNDTSLSVGALFLDNPSSSASQHSVLVVTGFKSEEDGAIGLVPCRVDAMWATTYLNQSLGAEIDFRLARNTPSDIPASNLLRIPAAAANRLISPAIKDALAIEPDLIPDFPVDRAVALALADSGPFNAERIQNQYAWADNVTAQDAFNALGLNGVQYTRLKSHISSHNYLKKYDGVYVATVTDWTDPTTLTHQVSHAYRQGFGYNINGVTVKLSVAVVGIYCIIATVFLIWTLVTGLSASHWDNNSELFMLGVNSRRPGHMGHTSVGLETLSSYREPVHIRANQEQSLELVFENDLAAKGVLWEEVQLNRAY